MSSYRKIPGLWMWEGLCLAGTVDFFSEIAMPSDSTAEPHRAWSNSLARVSIWTAEGFVEFFEG